MIWFRVWNWNFGDCRLIVGSILLLAPLLASSVNVSSAKDNRIAELQIFMKVPDLLMLTQVWRVGDMALEYTSRVVVDGKVIGNYRWARLIKFQIPQGSRKISLQLLQSDMFDPSRWLDFIDTTQPISIENSVADGIVKILCEAGEAKNVCFVADDRCDLESGNCMPDS